MGRGKRKHARVPANVVLGLGEEYTLEQALEAHRELSLRYRESKDTEMLAAVDEAYSILKDLAEARSRGEAVDGMAVVAVRRSAAEVARYLLDSDEDEVLYSRSRDGMPDLLGQMRRATAVVAPVV